MILELQTESKQTSKMLIQPILCEACVCIQLFQSWIYSLSQSIVGLKYLVTMEVKLMTSTQVKYWEYREGKRHNRASEIQNKYHLVTERMSASEVRRHNKVTEKLGKYDAITRRLTASETKRHNIVTEATVGSQIALNQAKTAQSYSSAGYYSAKTSESRAATKLTLTKLDKYNLQAVLTTGPKWAKNIAATTLLGDILADPNQNKVLKQAAMEAWNKIKVSKDTNKTYLFTAGGYNYYTQYSKATGLNMFYKEKVGSGKQSPSSYQQATAAKRKEAYRQTESRNKNTRGTRIKYDQAQAARRRQTN